jgi:uncharacterized protein YcsI (UPF0317 family)
VELSLASAAAVRSQIRAGLWRRPTVGLADGWVQANLVIVGRDYAADFREFCARNPRPCPLLEVTAEGSPEPVRLAPGSDLRTDVPRYHVYRHGVSSDTVDDLLDLWQADFVSFLLGCSFTFDPALRRAGIPLRHVELGRNIAMFRTNRACAPAGPFSGPLVVSMRPIPDSLVDEAVRVTERFGRAHGAPVHVGDPAALGIADLSRPDYGDALPVGEGETPVFWACGVTPQAAALSAALPVMITHAPGYMFVTDMREEELVRAER